LPEFALGTASHAADQLVSRDAVTRAKLLRALKLNSVGEGPIRFVGRLRQSCPPKHLNDLPFRDQQGNKHLSFVRPSHPSPTHSRRKAHLDEENAMLGVRVAAEHAEPRRS
jgi:hypothetical protein